MASQAVNAPTVVGGCRLGPRAGRGARSEVFHAIDLASGAEVAFKRFVPPAQAERADWLRRFEREAAVLQRLRHPDILRLLRHGADPAGPWLVTDWVPGGDLGRHTQPANALPIHEVLAIGRRLARALHHAHGQGVLHRDLKPANVLFDRAGGILRLADFGLAQLDDLSATATGVALGSPAYSAPEQLLGAPTGPATDLYGLGVLLFELLAHRRPFESPSMGRLLQQVAQEPAPDLATLRPDLPVDLAALVACCLAKLPSQRPPDALALARALDAVAQAPAAPD